jgi:hypothetical protein
MSKDGSEEGGKYPRGRGKGNEGREGWEAEGACSRNGNGRG